MLVADKDAGLVLTGSGDVLEPEVQRRRQRRSHWFGGNYALAAARALMPMEMDAETVVRRAMRSLRRFRYTHSNLIIESIRAPDDV